MRIFRPLALILLMLALAGCSPADTSVVDGFLQEAFSVNKDGRMERLLADYRDQTVKDYYKAFEPYCEYAYIESIMANRFPLDLELKMFENKLQFKLGEINTEAMSENSYSFSSVIRLIDSSGTTIKELPINGQIAIRDEKISNFYIQQYTELFGLIER